MLTEKKVRETSVKCEKTEAEVPDNLNRNRVRKQPRDVDLEAA